MKSRPIGIFDSGIGGLTVANALHSLLPFENLIYFGDTAHLPYGDKSPHLLQIFISEITYFLMSHDVKAIVIACNTASAVGYDIVKEIARDIPVFEVIRPAAKLAIENSVYKKIGVIGTKTTIASHIYKNTLLEFDPNCTVVEKATPILVPMIEEGWIKDSISNEIIEAYLSDTGFQNIDSLILGCTHYPLIKNQVNSYFKTHNNEPVNVIDSSFAIANQIKNYLEKNNLFHPEETKKRNSFFVSDLTPSFEETAAIFFGKEIVLRKIVL